MESPIESETIRSSPTFRRHICIAGFRPTVAIFVLTVCLCFAVTSSLPISRPKRHAHLAHAPYYYRQYYRRHRDQFDTTTSGETATGSGLSSWPREYSYHVPRPGICRHDDDIFTTCFLCGKLCDDVRIYNGCCDRIDNFRWYCDELMS